MITAHSHCTLCNSAELGVLGREYQHAYLMRCQQCGLVFGARIPAGDELSDPYSKYPRNTSISPLTIKRYEELLAQFEPYRRTNKILDVGCGDGHFLEAAKKKGWNVYGTEYTSEACEPARVKGIEMYAGLIQTFSSTKDFDVITSFEVLEHLTDPKDHVTAIAKLLRTGGLFYFTTPNFNSLSRRWLGGKWKIIEYPEHLTYFTAQTAEKLVVNAGLLKLQVISTGITLRQFPNENKQYSTSEEQLRNSIESKTSLRILKRLVNYWLTQLNLGDSLKGYFVKP
jgi:2-polyprenyl-3-methyl-5-hydroxy-6-metoxy-1,4-benzoquinol methylase